MILDKFIPNLEKNMCATEGSCTLTLRGATCGNILRPLIKSALQAPQPLEAITLCDYDCTLSSMDSVICYIAASGWLSFMRGIDLLQRRLLYLGGLGRGEDENNQRKCALTQVYIFGSGPLGEWQVFIKGFKDFFLHLADCVCVHDPDR